MVASMLRAQRRDPLRPRQSALSRPTTPLANRQLRSSLILRYRMQRDKPYCGYILGLGEVTPGCTRRFGKIERRTMVGRPLRSGLSLITAGAELALPRQEGSSTMYSQPSRTTHASSASTIRTRCEQSALAKDTNSLGDDMNLDWIKCEGKCPSEKLLNHMSRM